MPLVTLHFVVNYFGGEWLGEMIAADGQVLYAIYYAVFYLLWAGFIVWRFGPQLGRPAMRPEAARMRAA